MQQQSVKGVLNMQHKHTFLTVTDKCSYVFLSMGQETSSDKVQLKLEGLRKSGYI